MTHIQISHGLDIPISGKPEGTVQSLGAPKEVSLNLNPFHTKFHLLARVGDEVKVGEPIADDKMCPGRHFVAPAAGVIREVRRGLKRRILDIVIDVNEKEEWLERDAIDPSSASRDQILSRLEEGGIFAHIRRRPFNLLAHPGEKPRAIFVKALESAPFVPPAEMQVEGYEKEFQIGLDALTKLTEGDVHLVYRSDSTFKPFVDAQGVIKHTAKGPHPIANHSVHIHYIDPIRSVDDCVWTVTAHDVVAIGVLMLTGRYHVDRVVSIAGPGILPGSAGYFRTRAGAPVSGFIAGRNKKGLLRLISGDPLMGMKVEVDDYLGFYDYCFTVIPENVDREMLYFFRLGLKKYTATKTYLGRLFRREHEFTTNQHGEERAFIDGSVYQKVMPMQILTMHLVKAILAGDYDSAEELGLLEVDGEDFALPTFICPAKIEMTDIVARGLGAYAADLFH